MSPISLLTILCKNAILTRRKLRKKKKEILANMVVQDYSDICRLCGDFSDIKLFSNPCPISEVKRIAKFCNFTITEGDALPQSICSNCLEIWNGIVKFRRNCKFIQTVLHDIYKQRRKAEKRMKKSQVIVEIESNYFSDEILNDLNQDSDFEEPLSKLFNKETESKKCFNVDCNKTEVLNNDKCIICGGCFYDKIEYQKHKVICQSNKEEKKSNSLICEKCGKSFNTQGQLKAHSEYHTNELLYMCEHCPYRGRTRGLLVIHLRTHTGYRPHKCEICGKSFVNSSNLRKHQWAHDKNRPYKCDLCEKSFVCENYLKKHQFVSHSGNFRVHKCITCSKGFPNRYKLKKHRLASHSELIGKGTAVYLRENHAARIQLKELS